MNQPQTNLYHRLLGFPESVTGPDHYELLGVPKFTQDQKVIRRALIDRSTQLRQWQNSKWFREAERLENEVIAAGAVLEDPVRKVDYDRELRRRLGVDLTPVVPVVAPIPAEPVRRTTTENSGSAPSEPVAPVPVQPASPPSVQVSGPLTLLLRVFVLGSFCAFFAVAIAIPPSPDADPVKGGYLLLCWGCQILGAFMLARRLNRSAIGWVFLALLCCLFGAVPLAFLWKRDKPPILY